MPSFTLEYWLDDGWYIGRLRGMPGVMGHGRTLADLQKSIREVYRLTQSTEEIAQPEVQTLEIVIDE